MQKLLILLLFFVFALNAQTKDDDAGSFGINFSGFVKSDVMYDSRQTVTLRDGHFLLYPAKEVLDQNGDDINAVPTFNILAIQTRLKGTISAPDVFGAKTSGVIEGAFFGHSNGDVNEFRLRHAFLKLAWKNSSLIIGQYWHPMFIIEAFPGTISFNTGSPFQPFARNPQIRYTFDVNNFNIGLTAFTQVDFMDLGPNGLSSVYLRNSGMPILDLTVRYKASNLLLGAGANYKSLLPRLTDTKANGVHKSDTKITSLAAMGFVKISMQDFTIKAQGVYGQNMTDLIMIGGYAVSDTSKDGFATEYTNIKTMSAWADLVYGKELQFALFAGYTENLGADDPIVGAYYSRGRDIANVLRISPRAQYTAGKIRFAAELEYTSAAYGTPDSKGVVKNAKSVGNLRVLLGTYLFF